MPILDRPRPALRKLTLSEETLRRRTAPELRRAVGGAARSNAYTSSCSTDGGHTDSCWTWNCPSRYPNC